MSRAIRFFRQFVAVMLACMTCAGLTGCSMILPDISHQPVVHNPFPQLSRVAVAPFFNQSDEAKVDGRTFALAYYAELQSVPGFEVVPLGVVEEAILANQIDLSHAGEARRLARVLGVDAVVIGSVTDFSPYYPPRLGMRVEWYAANPGFHEIPPGYGLPWGTPDEEFIPAPLVFEAEMALAKAQLATQTPACEVPAESSAATAPTALPPTDTPSFPMARPDGGEVHGDGAAESGELSEPASDTGPNAKPGDAPNQAGGDEPTNSVQFVPPTLPNSAREELAQYEEELLPNASTDAAPLPPAQSLPDAVVGTTTATGATVAHGQLPADWPDERGFIPPPPRAVRPACNPQNGPIMTHTRIYQGTDSEFTEALASYCHFRDDARFGGWQNYLQRSDDFIRFCCHLHISELLSARGGAGETRVVWQWPNSR